MFDISLLALSAAWIAFEIGLAVLRRSRSTTSNRDAGTLKTLNIVIYVAVTIAFMVRPGRHGWVRLPDAVPWSGLALIVSGLVFRVWAIRSLGRFFTVDVAIQPDHRIVRDGAYRYVRHPAYAGCLLSFVGLAVCTSNWISALVLLVPITAVFLYRVRVEERVLHEAFPQDYARYSEGRARLLPGVY